MNKKIVLITGGGSGIGLEMAKQMMTMDFQVIICGRNPEKLKTVKESFPSLITYSCDVTKSEDRKKLAAQITNDFGHLDMLINNAGHTNRYLFNMEDADQLEKYMDSDYEINQKAPMVMAKLFQPLLMKSQGAIVNITSALVYLPLFTKASYSASKAALHSMTKTLRYQLSDQGISVMEVFYPEVNTPFQQGAVSERAIKAEDAAASAIQGILVGKEEIRVKGAEAIYGMYKENSKESFQKFSSFVPKDIDKSIYYKEE